MKRILAALALCAISAFPAQGQTRLEVGLLNCVVAAGTGFVVGSTETLSCTFYPSDGRRTERYSGTVKKFGLDIGTTSASYIKWVVLAPTSAAYSRGALAGQYVGVAREATAGVGLGVNALVGGSDRTFTLQPVSVQAQQGVGIAAGFSSLELRSGER